MIDLVTGLEDRVILTRVTLGGVTKLVELCRFTLLYQLTKRSTQASAVSRKAKGPEGVLGPVSYAISG